MDRVTSPSVTRNGASTPIASLPQQSLANSHTRRDSSRQPQQNATTPTSITSLQPVQMMGNSGQVQTAFIQSMPFIIDPSRLQPVAVSDGRQGGQGGLRQQRFIISSLPATQMPGHLNHVGTVVVGSGAQRQWGVHPIQISQTQQTATSTSQTNQTSTFTTSTGDNTVTSSSGCRPPTLSTATEISSAVRTPVPSGTIAPTSGSPVPERNAMGRSSIENRSDTGSAMTSGESRQDVTVGEYLQIRQRKTHTMQLTSQSPRLASPHTKGASAAEVIEGSNDSPDSSDEAPPLLDQVTNEECDATELTTEQAAEAAAAEAVAVQRTLRERHQQEHRMYQKRMNKGKRSTVVVHRMNGHEIEESTEPLPMDQYEAVVRAVGDRNIVEQLYPAPHSRTERHAAKANAQGIRIRGVVRGDRRSYDRGDCSKKRRMTEVAKLTSMDFGPKAAAEVITERRRCALSTMSFESFAPPPSHPADRPRRSGGTNDQKESDSDSRPASQRKRSRKANTGSTFNDGDLDMDYSGLEPEAEDDELAHSSALGNADPATRPQPRPRRRGGPPDAVPTGQCLMCKGPIVPKHKTKRYSVQYCSRKCRLMANRGQNMDECREPSLERDTPSPAGDTSDLTTEDELSPVSSSRPSRAEAVKSPSVVNSVKTAARVKSLTPQKDSSKPVTPEKDSKPLENSPQRGESSPRRRGRGRGGGRVANTSKSTRKRASTASESPTAKTTVETETKSPKEEKEYLEEFKPAVVAATTTSEDTHIKEEEEPVKDISKEPSVSSSQPEAKPLKSELDVKRPLIHWTLDDVYAWAAKAASQETAEILRMQMVDGQVLLFAPKEDIESLIPKFGPRHKLITKLQAVKDSQTERPSTVPLAEHPDKPLDQWTVPELSEWVSRVMGPEAAHIVESEEIDGEVLAVTSAETRAELLKSPMGALWRLETALALLTSTATS